MATYGIPVSGAETDVGAWDDIVERLAADRSALVDDFIEKLSGSGFYSGYHVSEDDLRRTAGDTMDLLIRQLAGLPLPSDLSDLPVRVGVRRARQGVAREHLLEAVRLDFRVLWAGMLRAGQQSPEVLVLHIDELFAAVEWYASDIQAAFLAEETALAQDSRAEAWRAFSRLLNAGPEVDRVGREVAAVLGVRFNSVFEVAALVSADAAAARRLTQCAEQRGRTVSWDYDDVTVFVREQAVGSNWLDQLTGVRGGYVGDIHTLAAVPAAIELARTITRFAGDERSRLAVESEVWPGIAEYQLRDALPSLQALRRSNRQLVGDLDTVFEYIRTGSIKQTGERLFCHRNTIINRLNAFRDHTGLDLTVPAEAARALLVFGPEYASYVRAQVSH
ncbi:helix-turn-helix domain-containing protein [Mycolicibacterium brisbanense]|uniref:Putative transcriptional regulator, PucR family n=1 Tax=Mycolicibacterium brisbanense TaxID=146020 RepID=A0A124E0V1_9MYCO|nr:helix-turn-helix domain-containing protein [Mycolicibacterium brisbanense]GAS91668.1 putative transcriptional regulator, PucR family [Mycolicibacterium brisbanense]